MSTQDVRYLSNGIPVLMMNYPGSKSVTMGIAYNVGGRNEYGLPASHNGISHFLEHQFFKGNDNLTPEDVHIEIDELGGLTNAYTKKAVTCYFTKCLNTEISRAINLWDELLDYGSLKQAEFDREAHVVKQEFRMGEDNTIQYLYRKLTSILHDGTSLQMDVIGTEESLSMVTLQEMEAYREKFYDLSNAVLLVLGNIDVDTVYQELNRTFGSKLVSDEQIGNEIIEYTNPEESIMEVYRLDKPSPLALLGMAIKTPGARSPDAIPLQILMARLNQGQTSMEQQSLKKSGLAAFHFSNLDLFEDIGHLFLIVGAPPGKIQQAHRTIMKIFYDLLTEKMTEDQLDKIIDQIEYDLRRRWEEPMNVLSSYADSYWSRGKFVSLQDSLDEYRSVSLKDYEQARTRLLHHLQGIYLMAGQTGDFEPNFPENTWDGIFSTKISEV